MIRHLLRPFSYLSIEHELKKKVDWNYPCSLSIISTGLAFWLQQFAHISLYADSGMISKILNFVQVLPGFYIAALAAIATFNRIDIDKIMPSPAPKIGMFIQGNNVVIELTRRRFLCSMFSFLTAESLILIVLAIFSTSFYEPLKKVIDDSWHCSASGIFIMIFLFLFWQMIITTFWGLYYLGERLHQPEPY